MSHHNYPGNPEITIQDCNTPRTPGSIQQYFPPNQGVCIQPNRGAIEKNQLWNNRQLYFSDKCNQPYNKTSPYSQRAPKVLIGNQKIYNSYPTYNANTLQNVFSIIEIPDEKYFACSAYDKLAIINGNNIQVSKTGIKNTFSISTTDNINIPGDLTVGGDLKLTAIKAARQDYVLYYNVDNNCVTYGVPPTGGGGDDSLADNIHDDDLQIEGDLTIDQDLTVGGDFKVVGDVCFTGLSQRPARYTLYYDDTTGCITYDSSCCDISADNNLAVVGDLSVGGDLIVRGDASLCDVSACNFDVLGDLCVVGNIKGNLQGDVTGNLEGDVIGNLEGNVIGNLEGDVIGNLEGDVIGNLEGNVTGNLQGNVTGGNVTGNLTGNLQGDVSANTVEITDLLLVTGDASLCDVSACNIDISENLNVGGAGTIAQSLVINPDGQIFTGERFTVRGGARIYGHTEMTDVSACSITLGDGPDCYFVSQADASFCDLSACNIDVLGDLCVTGNIKGEIGVISNSLIVEGDVEVQGSLDVDLDLTINGNNVCFKGLDETTTNYTLYYDVDTSCVTYGTKCCDDIDDLDVVGNLTVGGDLVVFGDASLCDVSACNLDISNNLTVKGDRVCFKGLDETTTNYTLYYDDQTKCVTYGTKCCDNIDDLDVAGMLTVEGDLRVRGDASLCDVSACNVDISNNLNVGENVEISGHTGVKTLDVAIEISVAGDLRVAGNTKLQDTSASNIDISENLIVRGDASLCDVSACQLDIVHPNLIFIDNLGLLWEFNGNKIERNPNLNFAEPSDFRTLGIDPGDVLHIYWQQRAINNQGGTTWTQHKEIVTVREIRQSFMLIAERFSSMSPFGGILANDFKIHVNKKKLKMETSRGENYAVGDPANQNNIQDLTGERVYSNWRLDNFGDLHIIPSGFTGAGCSPDVNYPTSCDELAIAGAPGCDGALKIWGRTKILRGADPSPNDSNGDSKLEIICYNSKAERKGEAWLTLKSSHDEAPCKIYFGNVGNKSVDTNVPDCANADGLGRIEYINSTGHIADRMRFGVSDGRDPTARNPEFMEALSINTQPNATVSTDYRPYIGVSESNPNFKLHINHNETGPILALDGGTGRENTLVFGTAPGGITYIDASKSSVFPGGSNLQLRAGGITVATCLPNSGTYPNAFDLTSQKLTIRNIAGVANQVLTATGNGAEVAWRTPTGGGGDSNSGGCVIPYEPWNINILKSNTSGNPPPGLAHLGAPGPGKVLWMQFIAPSTGPYTHMEVFTTGASHTNFKGTLGVAIYTSAINNNVGKPNVHLGEGIMDCAAGCNMLNTYSEIAFGSPINLTANVKYWAAMAWTRGQNADGSINTNAGINWAVYNENVIDISCTLVDGTGVQNYDAGGFDQDTGSEFLATSVAPTWFRIRGDCGGIGITRELIPYETWNANLLGDTTLTLEARRIYLQQFHAPSTGKYTQMTISVDDHSQSPFSGCIGVALYENFPTTAGPGRPTGDTIAKGVNNYAQNSQNLRMQYVTINFDSPIDLVANTLYWAAISGTRGGSDIKVASHTDYQQSQARSVSSLANHAGDICTGNWGGPFGANSVNANDRPWWFRINGPPTGAGQITDLAIYGNLQVFRDTEVTNITVTGDATLQDISASNIGITGDASFCDISACNIDVAGTVNISDTAAGLTKLFIENTAVGTAFAEDAPYNYDTTQGTNGYSYIKCQTGGDLAFQVDGDGSIKNRKSITICDRGWHNTGKIATVGLTLIANERAINQYPIDSLITTRYSTHDTGQIIEVGKKLVGLKLQASGEPSSLDRGIVKVIPNFGSNYTEFQFDNSTNQVTGGGSWNNTLWWTNNNNGSDQNSLYMNANNLGGRPKFQFKSGTEMILEWDSTNTEPIALGNANTNIKLGSGALSPWNYSGGSKVSCSFIDCNDISCNTFRGDYVDSLRYNQLTIGQKSTYVEIACSGTAPTWLSRGGIHLGIDSDITCGDSTISCTSNSNICNTRHKGTIGTFSSSSSCGTKVRGYSSITMTSLVGGVAAKLCVLKNKVEQQGFEPGFVTCSSVEGPQATIIMRGKALLKLPDNAVDVNNWYNVKMEINIDAATTVDANNGILLAPHSVPWAPPNGATPGRGMPPGTFNKMFDTANATFMVTSGTLKTARGEESVASVNTVQQIANPIFDYKWLYARLSSQIPNAGGGDWEAKFEIGAMMMGMPQVDGVPAEGLVVNYMITVPRRFWGSGETPNNPECFFADVEKTAVSQSDPSGEYFWNPYKTKDQINDHGGFGRWDDNGPARALDPEDHNHEEYASGDPQPGDSDYQKTYTQLNTCTGTDYETCGIATADPLGDGVNSAESGWTPLKDGPVGNPSHGDYTFTVDTDVNSPTYGRTLHNNFWEEDYKNGMWIQYELPQAETVIRYSFTEYHDEEKAGAGAARAQYIQEYRGRLPKNFRLLASKTGNENDWTTLDTQTNVPWISEDTITESQDRVFDITNSESYLFYRIVVDERGFSGQPHIRIVQIKLFRKRLPGDATLAAAGQQVAGPAQQVAGGNGNVPVVVVQPEIL